MMKYISQSYDLAREGYDAVIAWLAGHTTATFWIILALVALAVLR